MVFARIDACAKRSVPDTAFSSPPSPQCAGRRRVRRFSPCAPPRGRQRSGPPRICSGPPRWQRRPHRFGVQLLYDPGLDEAEALLQLALPHQNLARQERLHLRRCNSSGLLPRIHLRNLHSHSIRSRRRFRCRWLSCSCTSPRRGVPQARGGAGEGAGAGGCTRGEPAGTGGRGSDLAALEQEAPKDPILRRSRASADRERTQPGHGAKSAALGPASFPHAQPPAAACTRWWGATLRLSPKKVTVPKAGSCSRRNTMTRTPRGSAGSSAMSSSGSPLSCTRKRRV